MICIVFLNELCYVWIEVKQIEWNAYNNRGGHGWVYNLKMYYFTFGWLESKNLGHE
jgi:hypothetical protein